MATKRKSSEDLSSDAPREETTPTVDLTREENAEDEEDDNRLYCICQTPNDESKPMIACDDCDEWYHARCMGVNENAIDRLSEWHCGRCKDGVPPDLSLISTSTDGVGPPDPKRKKYDESTITEALNEVRDGKMSIGKAAITYLIPKSTLQRRLRPLDSAAGPSPTAVKRSLTLDEEARLVEHFKLKQLNGDPIFRKDMRTFIQDLFNARDSTESAEDKVPNDNKMPSNKWFRRFFLRHPEISETKINQPFRPDGPRIIIPSQHASPSPLHQALQLARQPANKGPVMPAQVPVDGIHTVFPPSHNGARPMVIDASQLPYLPPILHDAHEQTTANGHVPQQMLNGHGPSVNGSLTNAENNHLYPAMFENTPWTMLEIHEAVKSAKERIKEHVLHTPLIESHELGAIVDNQVFLKMESEQLTGSFKLRGAFNKLCKLQEDPTTRETINPVTASSGNHGLACVHAMKKLKLEGTVFVPNHVSETKFEALRMRGADVIKYGDDCVEVEAKARETAQNEGRVYVSPYNDYDVIAGNGTVAYEILDDLPEVDVILVSVGGGGLASGVGAYIKAEKPSCQVIGVQPEFSKVMYESVKAGKIIFEDSKDTFSDGTAGGVEENSVTFKPCQEYIDDWLLVSEEDIAKGIKFMVDVHHKIVEGAAGLCIGAYMANAEKFRGKTVALIMCGANISTSKLLSALQT